MIVTIKTAMAHILPMLPIIGAGVVEQGEITKLSTAGIMSRVLELAILGAIFLYTTVQVLDSKIEHIEEYLNKHEVKCEQNNKQMNDMHVSLMLLQQRQMDYIDAMFDKNIPNKLKN